MSGRSARNSFAKPPTWRSSARGPKWPRSCRDGMTRMPASSIFCASAGVRTRVATLTEKPAWRAAIATDRKCETKNQSSVTTKSSLGEIFMRHLGGRAAPAGASRALGGPTAGLSSTGRIRGARTPGSRPHPTAASALRRRAARPGHGAAIATSEGWSSVRYTGPTGAPLQRPPGQPGRHSGVTRKPRTASARNCDASPY